MRVREIIAELNILNKCSGYGIPLWQCPQFLFPIMGIIIIISLLSTHGIGRQFIIDPYVINFIVLSLATVLISMAFLISKSFERLAEANRLKSEFVGVVSHQLRSPLSNLQWGIEYLMSGRGGKVQKGQTSYFEILKENSTRMQSLVNDLLEVSRIEEGSLSYEPKPFSLLKTVKKVVSEFEPYATAANVAIEIEAKDLPQALGDSSRVEQVIQNLLDNSIRYTRKGSSTKRKGVIKIYCKKKGSNLVFKISDNGIGIPKDDQRFIFHRFFRSQNVLKHETQGTGLGLYIAKAVVEKSGGTIKFRSKENKGSTFWFTIPIHT